MSRARRLGVPAGQRAAALRSAGHRALLEGDLEAAERGLSEALAIEDHAGAWLNLAVVHNRSGRPGQALASTRRVLARAPHEPLAWINHGMALKSLARYEEAGQAFANAGDHPMALYNRGMVCLQGGEWAEGFALLEARKPLVGLGRDLATPEWRGEPLAGLHLLVLAEQGLGDTLMLARCLRPLAERAARVTMLVAAPLERLLARAIPEVRFATHVDPGGADRWVGALSLPHRLGVRSPADLPAGPWLRAETAAQVSGPGLRAGINWAGNPQFAYDRSRSTTLATFRPLLELPGVDWCSLHRGARAQEAAAFGLPEPLADARDFADTADVIAGLDLVVSTETAVPNLAGALGVRTLVLTAPDVDWRWRGWYPTVEVCAQPAMGDWPGALHAARSAIALSLERPAA